MQVAQAQCVADAGPDTLVCAGQPVVLGGPGGPGLTYVWSPAGGLNDSTLANPTATPGTTTTYVLTVTGGGAGCPAVDSVTVSVNPLPEVPSVYNLALPGSTARHIPQVRYRQLYP